MKNMNRHVALLGASILWAGLAFASDEFPVSDVTPVTPHLETSEVGMYKVFVGIDMGTASLATVPANESKKSGYQFDVKGTVSYYLEHWDFDAGAGYFSNNISSSGTPHVRVVTNGALIALEPQYRVTSQFQLGPVFDFLIGTDVSFSESEPGASSKSINALGGLGAKYEFSFGKQSMRLVAQGMTTMSSTDRLIWIIQGGVQFGFPFSGGAQQ